MGGLGVMLTALAIAQFQTDSLKISVVLPHYAFLTPLYSKGIRYHSTIDVPIGNATGRSRQSVECKISLLRWEYTDAGDFLSPLSSNPLPPTIKSINIYLVGPGNKSPFTAAFQVPNPEAIYSSPRPLPQEWKDLWFAKAASLFVLSLKETVEKVDVVHLHGATNAMIANWLRESGRRIPAIVYTLHDSLDEVEYTNLVSNIVHFLDTSGSTPFAPYHPRQLLYSPDEFTNLDHSSPLLSLTPWIHHERYQNVLPSLYKTDNRQLFSSALGIDLADQITFVSRSIARDLVEGRFRFPGEELVMPSMLQRARTGDFVGVSNGLDFTVEGRNPFTSRSLLEKGLAFPRVGEGLLDERTFSKGTSFVEKKRRAKQHLISLLPQYFSPTDLDRPLLLFIGRYQYNKGVEFFSPLLDHLSANSSAHLVALGTRNNYPIHLLRSLAQKHPHQFTCIESSTFQEEFGTIIRLASDFAFVPSFSEAFGLVAVEGMLFGQGVISSGVGGLKEFLVEVDNEGREGNAHLFEIFPSGERVDEEIVESLARKARPGMLDLRAGIEDCLRVVDVAIRAWRVREDGAWVDRERFVRRMVNTALELRWDRENGPVDEVSLSFRTRQRRLMTIDSTLAFITKHYLSQTIVPKMNATKKIQPLNNYYYSLSPSPQPASESPTRYSPHSPHPHLHFSQHDADADEEDDSNPLPPLSTASHHPEHPSSLHPLSSPPPIQSVNKPTSISSTPPTLPSK